MDANLLRDAYAAIYRCQQNRKREIQIKIALLQRGTTATKIARRLGISKALLSKMFAGTHKGYAHRAAVARALGLAESAVFPDGGRRREKKTRRAA